MLVLSFKSKTKVSISISLRNEFISEYFQTNFNVQELESIFLNINIFQIPISKNDCLTIDKLHNFNNDKTLIKNIFDILKNRERKFEIIIDNQTYHACINNKLYNDIEKLVIKHIENKTEKSHKLLTNIQHKNYTTLNL